MEEMGRLLEEVLNRELIRAILSNPRKKDGIIKVKIRPVEQKGKIYFQFEAFTKTQAFHENLEAEEAVRRAREYIEEFKQMQIETTDEECTVLVSRKGKATIRRKKRQTPAKAAVLAHDRSKRYILEEGTQIPFMQDLGVMTKDGKVVRAKFDKFRQINRFLEFVEDILPNFDREREVTIIDFGCGKSYLTFAMYYYLHELKQYDIHIIGLDLKKDVIGRCRKLAGEYGYEKLDFFVGDIADYEGAEQADMVVTLHACDTATDHALAKAVRWNAKVILSVPCCQHELNFQLEDRNRRRAAESGLADSETESAGADAAAELAPIQLAPILEHGLLRERFAALLTDGLRAKYLEREGYETQILEFIDMEHTPKNILIRAVKRGGKSEKAEKVDKEIKMCEKYLKVRPAIGELMDKRNGI